MKKIIVGLVLLVFGRIVPFAIGIPFAGSLILLAGLVLLIWGIVEKARESGGSTGVDIAPLAKTDDLRIFEFSGTVVGIQSRTVINNSFHSSTSGGGGYLYQGTGTVFAPQTYTSSSTSSIEVVRYFIKDDAGEFSFELNNPPLAVRESHRLSTVYAGNSTSSTKGSLVAVVNHDTGKSFLLPYSAGVERLVKHEMRISGWLLLAMAAVVFFLFFVLAGGSDTQPMSGLFSFLASAAVLVSGLVKNYRAGARESLSRDVIVTSIRSKVMDVLASEKQEKFEAHLREYEKNSGA